MFQLAEIDPCQKHACPRPAGGARSALAVAVAVHTALIAALAAITLAQPDSPVVAPAELQAGFAPEPRPATDARPPEALVRHPPRLIAEAGEPQSTLLPPAPTRLAIPDPSPQPDTPPDLPHPIVGEFISAQDPVSDGFTPPPPREMSAPQAEAPENDPPKKAKSTTEVTFVPARVRSTSRPNYPSSAMRRGDEGVAQIRLSLDAAGRVTGAMLSGSSGHAALDAAALKAAARWQFSPATRDGRPVASAIVVPIRFSLR